MFPHHENEIAQSEACTGEQFVRMWLHSEHLIVENKKMSKSLGNFFTLRDLLERGFSGAEARYMLLQTHYKTQLNFTFEGMESVKHSLRRLHDFVQRMQEIQAADTAFFHDVDSCLEKATMGFAQALADDLNISVALASLFEMIREVNGLADNGRVGRGDADSVLDLLRKFNGVLWFIDFNVKEMAVPEELEQALADRIEARKSRDWAKADQLRDYIQGQGYVIEDSSNGPRLKKIST
jgi:cysteinyl-tRNA synthetase